MRIVCVVILVAFSMGVVWADSLFTAAVAKTGTLVSNKQKEFEVGDIVTVLVRETIQALTQSNTDTKKDSEVQSEAAANENPLLTSEKPEGLDIISPEQLPAWHVKAKNEQRTTGKTQRTNTLTTTVTCVVTEVLENNLLRIEGTKRVAVNREDSELRVSGTVRARDVSSANTILSDQIANAVIELRGRGPLWNNQRRGLLTRLLDWFSPF